MSVTIQVNRQLIEAEPGEMLIQATDRAGIYIPRFCYHPKLSIAANCRMCLVEVGNAPPPPVKANGKSKPRKTNTPRKLFTRAQIQIAPKPLPACATPVTERMVVFTESELAREAQAGTLEFLLINHPLDCPVCDQGGECPLQDQAMGYGADDSRFAERKRAVASPDIGPLVATEMTRCIHCTRCVRFGEEVAGVMELGMPGRGESAHIATFLDRTLDSEVSGNMIDLCPVGALTSKPYRFAARAWELLSHRGISPHDCVGANLRVQTLRGRIERILPRDNPHVNDCWLADRDRYSYEALHHPRRLTAPMIKRGGAWHEVGWEEALQRAADGIRAGIGDGGGVNGVGGVNGAGGDGDAGENFAALGAYTSTLEEYYLLQKLARAIGSNHIDHRMQQCDFRDDAQSPLFPSAPPPPKLEHVRAALLIGSNLRKEQPLLALRLRAAVQHGAHVCALNPIAYQQNFDADTLVTGADLPAYLAAVCSRLAARAGKSRPPAAVARWAKLVKPDAAMRARMDAIVDALLAAAAAGINGDINSDSDDNTAGVVALGALALQHPDAAVIRSLATWICEISGARLAHLAPGNSAAAWQAGCLPHRAPGGGEIDAPGHDARAMLESPHRVYLLLATDPELDAINSRAAADALRAAKCVVRITAFLPEPGAAGDVLLPMAAFAESAGTFVNCEGRAQRADAAAAPRGQARPAWKILRVLGNFLGLPGFDYVSLDDVRKEFSKVAKKMSAAAKVSGHVKHVKNVKPRASAKTSATKTVWEIPPPPPTRRAGLTRLADMPIYRGDQIVRHADALQNTADNPPPAARMSLATLKRIGVHDGNIAQMKIGDGVARLRARADERVPNGCVYIPLGHRESASLGGHGKVTVTPASARKTQAKKKSPPKSKVKSKSPPKSKMKSKVKPARAR